MYKLVVKNLVIGTIEDQPNLTVEVDQTPSNEWDNPDQPEWVAKDFEYEPSEVVLTDAGKGFTFGTLLVQIDNPDHTFDGMLINVDTNHTVEVRGCRFRNCNLHTNYTTVTLTVEHLMFNVG